MSKVYLAKCSRNDSDAVLVEAVNRLWVAAEFDKIFKSRELVALKLHVGEPGTKTFTHPTIARTCVTAITQLGAEPFLTDTAVLYKSPRNTGLGHTRVAYEHGFTIAEVGAPFIPADGLLGTEAVELPISGKHFSKVSIASAIVQAGSMLVLSHATGHLGTGFGGTLKNLGMGCCSRKAKLQQHHGDTPKIDPQLCTGCGTCAQWCPSEAIAVTGVAEIDAQKCIGCGECIAVCRDEAVSFGWKINGAKLQERIVEHAAAVVRNKLGRIAYITVAQSITKDCDCLGLDQAPVVKDIGILAALDPVALDWAVLELVKNNAGQTLESLSYPKRDASVQISYAVSMGLGESQAEIVEV